MHVESKIWVDVLGREHVPEEDLFDIFRLDLWDSLDSSCGVCLSALERVSFGGELEMGMSGIVPLMA